MILSHFGHFIQSVKREKKPCLKMHITCKGIATSPHCENKGEHLQVAHNHLCLLKRNVPLKQNHVLSSPFVLILHENHAAVCQCWNVRLWFFHSII